MKKYLLVMLTIISVGVTLVSCSSSDDNDDVFSISQSEISFTGNNNVIKLTSSAQGVSWESENPYVASVSNDGSVKSVHVGETYIVAHSGGKVEKCKVVVRPKYSLFMEPITEFGISKDEVIKRCGTPFSESTNELIYSNQTNDQAIDYEFKNEKLASCTVILKATTEMPNVSNFLIERYEIVPKEFNGKFAFINALTLKDASMLVLLTPLPSNGVVSITYIPHNRN